MTKSMSFRRRLSLAPVWCVRPPAPGELGELELGRVRAGFTLIEVMLVIVLMGVVSCLVVVRYLGIERQRQLQDTLGEIVFFDQLARSDAQRANRPEMLVLDLDHQRIDRVDAQSQDVCGKGLSLGALGASIEEVRLQSGTKPQTSGQVSLPCSAQGTTPSYALAVSGPGNQKRWLFVAGVTGQWRVFTDASQVEPLIEVTGNASR